MFQDHYDQQPDSAVDSELAALQPAIQLSSVARLLRRLKTGFHGNSHASGARVPAALYRLRRSATAAALQTYTGLDGS